MQDDGFADRLDALEERRDRAEARMAATLERAHGLVEELAARAEAAHAHRRRLREALEDELPAVEGEAGDPEESRARGPGDLAERRPEDPPVEGLEAPLATPAGGGFRGLVERLRLWLFRPWLERRRQRQRRRLRELQALATELRRRRRHTREALDRLRRRQAALRRSVRRGRRERAERFSWMVASSQHAVETLAAAVGVHDALVRVADARGAETVHRATRPVDEELEAAFLELGRRQEALLAELVGSRRWLDELRRRGSTLPDP